MNRTKPAAVCPARRCWIERFASVAAATALMGLSGCAIDEVDLLPDEDITQQEREAGDRAVEAIVLGGADPTVDNAQPSEQTDGAIEVEVPEAEEPTDQEQQADAQMLEGGEGGEGDRIVREAPTADIEGEEEAEAQGASSSDEGTGASVESLREGGGGRVQPPRRRCRKARGFLRGMAYRICVVRLGGKLLGRRTAKAFTRMRAAARRSGVRIRVVSGFRTMRQQRFLYGLYLRGRGNLAARPGYSNHQSGIALDLNTASPGVYRWLARNAHRFGFRRTVPSEPWHWEYRR